MSGPVLYQFGPIQFNLWPLNVHEFDHVTGSAFARKDVLQAVPQREWTGEDDETFQFQGRVFPDYMPGSVSQLTAFEACRKQAMAQMLIRGADGYVHGWFVIEKLRRNHKILNINGIGRVITFDTMLSRCDSADAGTYFNNILQLST